MKITWKQQYVVRYDKRQTKFDSKGNTNIDETIKELSGLFHCPFCLHQDTYSRFLASSRMNLIVCPECGCNMKTQTLTMKMTIKQFANWVYEYSMSDFWQKCSYNKFNQRLKETGLDQLFWNEYKKLKGETEPEETLLQKQERLRYECQKCGEQNKPDTTKCWYCGSELHA